MVADKTKRTARQWSVPVGMAALYLLGPLGLNAALPQPTLGWAVLGLVVAVSLLGGLLDARVFRFNLTVVTVAVVAFFVSKQMYYNPGAWIYVILVGLLTLGGVMGGDYAGFKAVVEKYDTEDDG